MAATKTTELVVNLLLAGIDEVNEEITQMFPRGVVDARRILARLSAGGAS